MSYWDVVADQYDDLYTDGYSCCSVMGRGYWLSGRLPTTASIPVICCMPRLAMNSRSLISTSRAWMMISPRGRQWKRRLSRARSSWIFARGAV